MRVRAAVLAGLATLVVAAPASAETWTVVGNGDDPVGCNALTRVCPSIRAAINISESKDYPDPDTILVPEGQVQVNNDLVISTDITIIGKSARTTIIHGSDKYRGFRIVSGGNAKISHLTVTNGVAGQGGSTDGGGILNLGGVTQLDYVRVTNSNAVAGGGIATVQGTLTLQHGLVDNNTAGTGAGIAALGGPETPQRAQLGVADSTIFNNTAGSGGTGGIDSRGGQSNVMVLFRTTVADNDGGVRGTGGINVISGAWQALSNIVVRNLEGGASSNCGGTLAVLAGANLENDKECNFELQGANPQLAAALSNQGGETNVLTIGASSPARDLIAPGTSCTATTVDQRGLPRPQGGGCDSGAYEIDVAPTVTITAGPSGTVATPDVQFQFSSTEPGVAYECQLTGPGQSAGYSSCTSPRNYSALANGSYTFSVRALDGTFPNPTPATRTFTVAALDTTITGGPSGLTNDNTPTFTFTGVNGAAGFQCRVDAGQFLGCTSPHTTAALADGSHTFEVRALGPTGAPDPTPASRSFTVDTVAPNTSIATGPSGTVASTSATFTYTSTEPGSSFQCSLDGAAFGTCPASYTGLSQGSHTFQVRAIDPAGNTDASPASRTWTVDTVAPDTSITAGPSGTVASTSATFTFTSTEPLSTFQCALDGGQFGTCPASYTGLSQGSHTFQVRATDPAGNTDATPASRTWTVDTVAPDTTITVTTPTPSNDTTPTWSFTSTEAGSTFQCRIGAAAFTACASPFTNPALAQGTYTFEVRAIDPAGNTDATPASQTFVIDTTAPNTTITATTPTPSNDTTPTWSFTSTETGSTFQCRIGTAAFTACASPFTNPALTQGTYTFEVRAIDPAGNTDATPASQTFVIDTTAPPAPTITAPAPGALLGSSSVVFTGTAEAGATVRVAESALSATGVADSGNWTATVQSVPDGQHTFSATATDAAGNTSPATTRTFTVDAVEPDTTITSGPTGPTNTAAPTFTFTSTKPGSTFTCRVDGAAFAPCPSPHTLPTLAEGQHTFQVQAIAPTGNPDPTPASATFTVDLTPPETTIGDVITEDTVTPTFALNSSEPGSTFECRVDAGGYLPCTSPHTTAALSQGSHTFFVRATDLAGNQDPTPAQFAFVVDTEPPDPPAVAGPSGPVNTMSPTFTFDSPEPDAEFRCSLNGSAFEACVSPKTYTGLPEDEHTFEVLVVDSAGHESPPVTRKFSVDVTPPEPPEVGDGPSGPTSNASPSFTFRGPAGTRFDCHLSGPRGPGSFGPCTSPATFSALDPGDYVFFIRATDPAGNQTVTQRAFTVTSVQAAQTPTPTPPVDRPDIADPQPGKSVAGTVARGTVLVKLKGRKTFVRLDPTQPIPLGSEIDTRKGAIRMFAQGKAGARLDDATFSEGMFVVGQSGGITELRLSEKLAPCKQARAASAAAKKKPKSRRLWGDGKGKFRTRGSYSAATVRGTKWLTQDTCAGTLTRVTQGTVAVKDLVTKKTVLVKKGKRYTAKPRKRR